MNSKNYMMCDFVAKEYGAIAGVLYTNIEFWIEKNKANNKHFYEGRYWTYNSRRAFALLFPMFTEEQIKNALKKMIEGKLIIKGNFNKMQYDRTCWYTIDFNRAKILHNAYVKYTQSIGAFSPMENAEIPNGLENNTQPIPYINTDINTDSVDTQTEKEAPHTPIDNSYYDITTNTYSNVEPKAKSEYEDFELLFIQAFNTLTVSVCSELFQLTGFRGEDKRQRLKEIFDMRKYDYKKCINKAISEAQKAPANKRWFHFLDFLKDYLINGYNGIVEVSNQPTHSKSYSDLLKEEVENKAKKQIELENEAKAKGITVAELEAQNEKEIEADIDNIKNMLGFGNLSEAIENSDIGIKEIPKGKEYKPAPYIQKKLSKEDENQIQDLLKKARENSKRNSR